MPIDLYGDKPTDVLKGLAGRQIEQGKTVAGRMFGAQAMPGFQKQLGRIQTRIDEAIEAWGLDALMNWQENSAAFTQALQQDLKTMRNEANQARLVNDMDRYQIALSRILFDKKMLEYKNQLDKARIGDIITAIIGGLGQIAAIAGTRAYERKLAKEYAQISKDRLKELETIMKYYDYPVYQSPSGF